MLARSRRPNSGLPDYHARVSDRAEVPEIRLLVRCRVDMNPVGHFLEPEWFDGAGGGANGRAEPDGDRERKPSMRSGAGPSRLRNSAQAELLTLSSDMA